VRTAVFRLLIESMVRISVIVGKRWIGSRRFYSFIGSDAFLRGRDNENNDVCC
jgi:hypothetical protein